MLGELCQPTGAGPELFHKFMMNASMEMSKSSRRKQSKPNRLFADEESATTPKLDPGSKVWQPSPRASPIQRLDVEYIADDAKDDKDPMDLSTKAAVEPVATVSPNVPKSPEMTSATSRSPRPEMEMVSFPCHTCGEMFASRAQQEQHISLRHSSETPPKAKLSPSSGSMFPTAYHRLATELGLGPLAAGMMLSSNKAITDQSKISPGSNGNTVNGVPNLGTPGVGGKGSAGTVFQREAYCEICQREFCNKYFLKTHKANIHGIVDPSDLKAVAVMNKVNQTPQMNSISPSQELTIPALPVMPPQQQKVPANNSTTVQKPLANESMEDFCEICQKHFCNKYYLKKHKMDVHNIRPDGSRSQSSNESLLLDSRSCIPHAPPVSSTGGMPHLPMMVPSLNHLHSPSMNNMLFVNPFVPNMAAMSMVPPMMQHQFFMPSMSNLAAAHAATQALSNNISPETKPEQKQPITSLERGESMSDSDKAEAFCNICRLDKKNRKPKSTLNGVQAPQALDSRKEFCNSYFLQIHKANKHGIFDDVATSAALMMSMAGQPGAAGENKDQGEGQTSKMSMTMSASPASSNASTNIRPVVVKSDKDRHQTSPAFSLQSTMSSRVESAQAMLPTALSFDAMLAAKQADRIMCDICNKEVCNKYFLKAHKLKMHGIAAPTEDKRITPTKEMTREVESHHVPMPTLSMHQPQQQQQPRQPQQLQHQPQALQQSHQQPQISPPDAGNVTQNMIKLGIDPEAYCFICKQEFCSKYFLKTHKLNMHGLKMEDSPQQQRTTPKGTITPPTSVSPLSAASPAHAPPPAINADTFQWKWKDNNQGKTNSFTPIGDASANAGGGDQFTWRWKEPANATRVFCDICNKELCNKYFLRTHKLNKHGIRDLVVASPGKPAEQAMLASSMMADLARASQASHQNTKTQGTTGISESANRRRSPYNHSQSPSPTELDQQDAMRDDVCQICGMVFANVVAVHEHIRLEHSDESFEAPQSKIAEYYQKQYKCMQCPYKTSVWENLHSHEARKHDSNTNTCQTCQITFSHINMLIKHTREIHNKHLNLGSLEVLNEKMRGGRAGGGIAIKKQVKCNYCTEKFDTKQLRQSHIRSSHRNKSVSSKLYRTADKTSKVSHTRVYACDKCSYTCGAMRNLVFHQAMRHKSKVSLNVTRKQNSSNGVTSAAVNSVMQEFNVSAVTGAEFSLAKSTIMLPVCQRITDGVTINLTLVPSK